MPSPEEMRELTRRIWEGVKENSRKLEACPGHDFSIDLRPDRPVGKDWQCTRCGGRADTIAKLWYERGLEHGRPALAPPAPS